jgi:hypothetical protein
VPSAFNFAGSPLDCLSIEERQLVRDSVDIAFLREGEAILEPGTSPSHLFVITSSLATTKSHGFAPTTVSRPRWPRSATRNARGRIMLNNPDWRQPKAEFGYTVPPYQHGASIDLRPATLMEDLKLPQRHAHDALNDAIMAALSFVKLKALLME